MHGSACPGFAAHKRTHDVFLLQVRGVGASVARGHDKGVAAVGFLGKWLSGHVLGVDRGIGAYFHDRTGSLI